MKYYVEEEIVKLQMGGVEKFLQVDSEIEILDYLCKEFVEDSNGILTWASPADERKTLQSTPTAWGFVGQISIRIYGKHPFDGAECEEEEFELLMRANTTNQTELFLISTIKEQLDSYVVENYTTQEELTRWAI